MPPRGVSVYDVCYVAVWDMGPCACFEKLLPIARCIIVFTVSILSLATDFLIY